MADTHRIRPVLDKLTEKAEGAAKPRAKADKGKSHEFPSHQHSISTIRSPTFTLRTRSWGSSMCMRLTTTTMESSHDVLRQRWLVWLDLDGAADGRLLGPHTPSDGPCCDLSVGILHIASVDVGPAPHVEERKTLYPATSRGG